MTAEQKQDSALADWFEVEKGSAYKLSAETKVWITKAFVAGAVWEREECAKIADTEAELHDRFALEDAGTEGAVEHSIVAAEASRIAQRIRGRPVEIHDDGQVETKGD